MSGFANKLVPWRGHPAGLPTLFATEAWERFSYYGMRALLVLYFTSAAGSFQLERAEALRIYATYTALVYLSPLFGGFLADRILGQRVGVLIGGIVMAAGQFALMARLCNIFGVNTL